MTRLYSGEGHGTSQLGSSISGRAADWKHTGMSAATFRSRTCCRSRAHGGWCRARRKRSKKRVAKDTIYVSMCVAFRIARILNQLPSDGISIQKCASGVTISAIEMDRVKGYILMKKG
ncbi:hypothetical protein DL89DRAFT_64790 [Linderina pennispora]|uniref:Uncharacterized protein n=1 Tax=Linderina pennispora TaxID=61395 RepID=A0A1Y1VZ64_9FUNG|nr:uncharacterized protein DL89DRAFT_64790 [Linderina pennispora]ORX66551.1 hypothetical protein DL89DRAFT_64790 [Linderina pennispora]